MEFVIIHGKEQNLSHVLMYRITQINIEILTILIQTASNATFFYIIVILNKRKRTRETRDLRVKYLDERRNSRVLMSMLFKSLLSYKNIERSGMRETENHLVINRKDKRQCKGVEGRGVARSAGYRRRPRGGWPDGDEEDKGTSREERRKPGTSRFCYDQWQTGTQSAAVRIDPRDYQRWTPSSTSLSRVTSSVLRVDLRLPPSPSRRPSIPTLCSRSLLEFIADYSCFHSFATAPGDRRLSILLPLAFRSVPRNYVVGRWKINVAL